MSSTNITDQEREERIVTALMCTYGMHRHQARRMLNLHSADVVHQAVKRMIDTDNPHPVRRWRARGHWMAGMETAIALLSNVEMRLRASNLVPPQVFRRHN